MRAAVLAFILGLCASAEAHDLDCHGMPVPEAEKLGCCGAGDAHFSDARQFYEGRDGFWHYLVAGEDFRLVRGVPENMNKIQPPPSVDGCYTVWFRVWSDIGILFPGKSAEARAPMRSASAVSKIPMGEPRS